MNIRQNDAKAIRSIRKILRGSPEEMLDEVSLTEPEKDFIEMFSYIAFWLVFVLAACFLLVSCSYADCSGLSPQLQKAYNQLKNDGFDVTCRKGL